MIVKIHGKVPSKSNCYKIVKFGNKASLAKAKHLKLYEESFKVQYTPKETISGDFSIELSVYYPDKRADLDNSLKIILDCLQMVGAIENDRYCQKINATRLIDKDNPRVEFKILKHEV